MNNRRRGYFQTAVLTIHNRFVLLGVLLLATPLTVGAITLGQIDDFQDGTAQNWQNGANFAANIATGGPGGAGDHYMQAASTGTGGTESRLVIYNIDQWEGNYSGAGVTAIAMDLNNFSATPLSIRLTFFVSPSAGYSYTTPVSLAANSGWQHATFVLTAGNFTTIGTPVSFGSLMSNFTGQLRLLDSSVPSLQGDTIAATLGADNIQAIPEPSTILMVSLGIGLGVLLCRCRKQTP